MLAEYSLGRISTSDRKRAAMSLREDGMTFAGIGKLFGVSASRARQLADQGVRMRQQQKEWEAVEARRNCPQLNVYEARLLLHVLDILKELPTLKVKKVKHKRPVYLKFWI